MVSQPWWQRVGVPCTWFLRHVVHGTFTVVHGWQVDFDKLSLKIVSKEIGLLDLNIAIYVNEEVVHTVEITINGEFWFVDQSKTIIAI